MIGVTAVMIAYNNEDNCLLRLHRDLLPALKKLDAELIVIDNSDTTSQRLADALITAEVDQIKTRYQWQLGNNLMYGPALNRAVTLATRPYLLYVCGNHGQSHDPSWATDLLAPLVDDMTRTVAMTGSIQDAGPAQQLGFSPDVPEIHIQGGVFAARTEVLRAFPYPEDRYQHDGADLFMCFQLMAAGFRLVDVPTIRSVWWEEPGEGPWKYVHEGRIRE
jgi:GT2 family glycosyltransferase